MNFPNGTILDVGCGEGTLSDYLNNDQREKYLGIDLSKEAVRLGKLKRPGIKFKSTNAENFVPRQKFDVIIFNEVLYYMVKQNKKDYKHFIYFLKL